MKLHEITDKMREEYEIWEVNLGDSIFRNYVIGFPHTEEERKNRRDFMEKSLNNNGCKILENKKLIDVVRCKNCKHYTYEGKCTLFSNYMGDGEFFCADGVQRIRK